MLTFWLALAAVGIVILAAQLLLGNSGLDADGLADADAPGDVGEGLHFLSMQSLSAAASLAGVAGFGLTRAGVPTPVVIVIAALIAVAAAVGVALAVRQLLRLQRDKSIRAGDLHHAVGVVYLDIPSAGGGVGKVHLTVREQLIELDADTAFGALEAGTSITVIDASRPDRVGVVALPTDKELLSE